jgi:hypothetical protein
MVFERPRAKTARLRPSRNFHQDWLRFSGPLRRDLTYYMTCFNLKT